MIDVRCIDDQFIHELIVLDSFMNNRQLMANYFAVGLQLICNSFMIKITINAIMINLGSIHHQFVSH
jgi:hypothetical protein